MICHHTKCIFVHIPKTAGQSVERVFLERLGLKWVTRAPLLLRYNNRPELGPPRLAHLTARDYVECRYVPQAMFDAYYKFGFVRNPWDRVVSLYKYLGFSKRHDFKSFLMKQFLGPIWKEKHWFVRPQSDFLYAKDGRLLVDFVGYFERIQSDFYQVCDAVGLPPTELPHINRSTGTAATTSWKRHPIRTMRARYHAKRAPQFKRYRDYYDRESMEAVASAYRSDIDLFGYTFGGD